MKKRIISTLLYGTAISATVAGVIVNPSVKQSFTGKDDLAKLKKLTMAVGWEFSPNRETLTTLKRLGIKKIRCINVDGLPGKFNKNGKFIIDTSKPSRLDRHLVTCKALGAIPHVIIGVRMPKALTKKVERKRDNKSLMGGGHRRKVCGPTNYQLYQNYWKAYIKYVMVTKGFKNAVFEVFNEPDIGCIVCPTPNAPARGSAALYNIMLNLYTHITAAANQFEKENQGIKVTMGGPALAWAYTFRFGSFNWGEQFIKDCATKKIRLDFVGVHYYGNISSINGEYKAAYPSFVGMLNSLKKVRDQYIPKLPIIISEWGPSYHTNNSEKSLVNADNVGAAWSMEFIKAMLENDIDDALYLVTTDLYRNTQKGRENIWGWPSLMVNPQVFGHAYPNAICNLFEMISNLKGKRIESTRSGNINSFAVADSQKKRIQVILWNYAARIPEMSEPVDFTIRENAAIEIRNAAKFFGSDKIRTTVKLISKTNANALNIFKKGEKLTWENTKLKTVSGGEYKIINGSTSIGCDMPASSVALIEIEGVK